MHKEQQFNRSANQVFFGLALLSIGLLALVLPRLAVAQPAAQPVAEFEFGFDDKANPGELVNSGGTGIGAPTLAYMRGSAARTAIDGGRYGRGLALDGGGSIEMGALLRDPSAGFYLAMWIKLSQNQQGQFLLADNSFSLELNQGSLVYRDQSGGVTGPAIPFGSLQIPADGKFHHLFVQLRGQTFFARLDFRPEEFAKPAKVPMTPTAWFVGQGLVGVMDDLWLTVNSRSAEDLRRNFDPNYCGQKAAWVCKEIVFNMTPSGWGQEVPVRAKVEINPQQCNPSKPCPLLVRSSGGGACGDDYNMHETFIDGDPAGRFGAFVTVSVDPTCQASHDYYQYPHESSQLVAAKSYLLDPATSPTLGAIKLVDLVEGPGYLAIGGSHGAGAVSVMAVLEADYPRRTFAMSSTKFAAHCAYHEGAFCPSVMESFDQENFGTAGHDDANPLISVLNKEINLVDAFTSELAASRELGVSWGFSTTGAVCDAQGGVVCFEEGMNFTYSGRRARQAWQAVEPAGEPTGYFFENDRKDCSHVSLEADQRLCVACFLRVGRAAMPSTCGECLNPGLFPPGPELPTSCAFCCDAQGCTKGACEVVVGDGGSRDGAVSDGGVPSADAGQGEQVAEVCGCSSKGGGLDQSGGLALLLSALFAIRNLRPKA